MNISALWDTLVDAICRPPRCGVASCSYFRRMYLTVLRRKAAAVAAYNSTLGVELGLSLPIWC